jgi:hypothetical protein
MCIDQFSKLPAQQPQTIIEKHDADSDFSEPVRFEIYYLYENSLYIVCRLLGVRIWIMK